MLVPSTTPVLERGGLCTAPNRNPETVTIIQCDYAMERLEGARVTVRTRPTAGISTSEPRSGPFEPPIATIAIVNAMNSECQPKSSSGRARPPGAWWPTRWPPVPTR